MHCREVCTQCDRIRADTSVLSRILRAEVRMVIDVSPTHITSFKCRYMAGAIVKPQMGLSAIVNLHEKGV